MADISGPNQEEAIEQWRIKRMVKWLDSSKGNGTSMISLIIPPQDDINRYTQMLIKELSTASNIKSRVNRQSVMSAITSTQIRLKEYNRTPKNGLVIYCGEIFNEEGKEKKVTIDFEPFRPINTSLYLCDNKFHTQVLHGLLENEDKFGFIIMDGHGTLYGTLCGNTREVLHKFSVELPKKHGRGGQSALRFARLRLEKRQNYVTKVAEISKQMFISNDKVNVTGIVLAGSADFKNDLHQADCFDPRLTAKVIKTVDVSYGGENGFNQAIELCAETLANVKFIQEKRLISRYFEEISQDSQKFCFGIEDTLKGLEMGAIDILIVYENLETMRFDLKNASTGEEVIKHLSKEQENKPENFVTSDGAELEVVEKQQLVEWFANNYKNFGAQLEFVTNRSQEGSQFVKGFGGIGGILRYKVDFMEHNYDDDDSDGSNY